MMTTNAARNANETRQLELAFGSKNRRRAKRSSQERVSRAQWWFQQMRRAVNEALDWSATPPARPEQTWLLPTRSPLSFG